MIRFYFLSNFLPLLLPQHNNFGHKPSLAIQSCPLLPFSRGALELQEDDGDWIPKAPGDTLEPSASVSWKERSTTSKQAGEENDSYICTGRLSTRKEKRYVDNGPVNNRVERGDNFHWDVVAFM